VSLTLAADDHRLIAFLGAGNSIELQHTEVHAHPADHRHLDAPDQQQIPRDSSQTVRVPN
jgi:hypothetical protein